MSGRDFETIALADAMLVKAPDGADVRILPGLAGGSFAQFSLPPGGVSRAVRHRTVEEIWYVTAGAGEMWRAQSERSAITPLTSGVALTVPLGCAFQFRNTGTERLEMVAVTMPPWPGEDEAFAVPGCWAPTV